MYSRPWDGGGRLTRTYVCLGSFNNCNAFFSESASSSFVLVARRINRNLPTRINRRFPADPSLLGLFLFHLPHVPRASRRQETLRVTAHASRGLREILSDP